MGLLSSVARSLRVQQLVRAVAVQQAAAFRQRDPRAAQRELFRNLLATGATTRFGRDYGLAGIARQPFETAYEQYRTRVPIRTYQQFWTDYFSAHQQGQALRLQHVTWPGTIKFFCETSGTTAPTKHVPFSDRMFAENRRAGLDLISCYLAAHPESRIQSGKILYMSGSTDLSARGDGIYSGDMSAITLRHRPWYLAPFVEPSRHVSALPWDDKLQAMAELLLRDPTIRVISGVPPWILLLLKRCRDLADGADLRQILPHLELIIHGGTSITPYRAEFTALFGEGAPHFIEVLPASEAFMGFQCAGEASLRLTPFYGAFFEFVRFEDLDAAGRPAPHAATVPLEQVGIGQRYAVILTTCSGLWRYHIGDTLRFTSLDPHFIEFTGRDRFLDKLEEKVTQEEVERVVADINRSGATQVKEFMVGTDVAQRRHIWVLAGAHHENLDVAALALRIDNRLRSLNADYQTFRTHRRIAAPEIILADEQRIYEWSRTMRGKLGGQSKIPHIDPTSDSSMIRELRAMCR